MRVVYRQSLQARFLEGYSHAASPGCLRTGGSETRSPISLMNTCAYACTDTHNLCTFRHVIQYSFLKGNSLCVSVHAYVHVCASVRFCALQILFYILLCTCVHNLYPHKCTNILTHACMHEYVCAFVWVCAYIYVCRSMCICVGTNYARRYIII